MADPKWLTEALADGRAVETSRVNMAALITPGPVPKLSKYRNTKVEIDGRVFDSKKEANRYLDLREEQRAGTISGLRCQVAFPLTVNGVVVASYVADFAYTRDGREVIEDCKSVVTRKLPVYRLKAKIMAALGTPVTES